MKALNLFIITIFIISCAEDKQPGIPSSMAGMSGNVKRAPYIPVVTKVNGDELYLNGLSAVKKQLESGYAVSVSYSPPPFARWVEIDVCSVESGTCIKEKSAFSREDLIGLPKGQLDITARACVEKEYSKDGVECGPTSNIRFANPEVLKPELEALYQQRYEIRASISDYTKKLRQHLGTFLDEMQTCRENEAQRNIAGQMALTIEALMTLGEKAIDLGIKEFLKDEKAVEETVASKGETSTHDKEAEKTKTVDEKASDKKVEDMTGSKDIAASIDAYLKSIKIFGKEVVPKDFSIKNVWADILAKGHKPVNAMKYIGGAITNLFYADKLIIPACLAEQRMKTTNAAAMQNLLVLGERLRDVNEAIKRLGGDL